MPKQRYQRQEPTHTWEQIRPKLTDSAQITYEIIRPVILWGETPKERAAETGMSMRTIYYKSNLFDQAGMPLCSHLIHLQSSLSKINVPCHPTSDKRS